MAVEVWEMTIVIEDFGFGCDSAMRDLAIRFSGMVGWMIG